LATSLPAGVRQRVAVPTDGMDVWRTATVYQARQGPATGTRMTRTTLGSPACCWSRRRQRPRI